LYCLTSSMVLASAPMARTEAPAFSRFMLGDFEVTTVSDGVRVHRAGSSDGAVPLLSAARMASVR
jgi:hypothetical protein